MNKELLEKMQWLYEQRFKPDMIYSLYEWWEGEKLCRLDQLNRFDQLSSLDDGILTWEPYFTESRLWSLLPAKILLDDTLFFLKLNSHIMYEPTYFTIDEKAGKPPMSCLYIRKIEDLHTALLDLVIFLVKEGYLKA